MGWAYLGNTFNKTVIGICALVSAWQPVESWVLRNPVIHAQTSELSQAPQINTNKQYNIYTDKDFTHHTDIYKENFSNKYCSL
jgi:hypothetical protein